MIRMSHAFAVSASLLFAGLSSSPISAQPALESLVPVPAPIQVRKVISISLCVPCTGKDAKRVTYSPPPGWYIRSHSVACTKKEGLASFTVTTVPAHWNSASDDASAASGKANVDAEGGLAALKTVKGKVSGAKEHAASEKHHQSFSHHALVVEAMVQGGGLFRSGSSIELSVIAEMVRIEGKEDSAEGSDR